MKQYRGILLFTALFLSIGSGILGYFNQVYGLIALGSSLALVGALALWLNDVAKRTQARMDRVFGENRTAATQIIENIGVPALIANGRGRIVWSNNAFRSIYAGKDLAEVLPQYNPSQPLSAMQTELQSRFYQIMCSPITRKNTDDKLYFQYWLDRTEAAHYQRLYTEQMPYAMRIYVDNYEELASDLQFHRSTVLAEVEKLVSEMTRKSNGIYCRYESGRFLCVFEAAGIQALEAEKFPLIEQARRIDTGTGASVSLSIAVGVAPRLVQSEEGSRLAMELALGRGGDQAVVKDGSAYRFYGGKHQQDTRQSRVKTRLFAKALRQLFENSGDVFIIGHRNEDMDCFGAMLGIAVCAQYAKLRAFMVIDGSNPTIEDAYRRTQAEPATAHLIISSEQAAAIMRNNAVLVVVDTQRPSTVSAPKLLDLASKVVLIDHHRRSADYIENATLHYLESRASSASEMVTEVIQYFDEGMRPTSFVCSCLLAGITVDTKQFAFNVGSRTFDAAGYLRRNGADLTAVKLMFQNDFETYVSCAKTVENAKIRESGIAVSHCESRGGSSTLIAARSADELLGIRGVVAAFVLCELEGVVYISGRSYGKVNVQLILESLGGGGHLTVAGAQLKGVSRDEAETALCECIERYEKENVKDSKGGI